MKEKKEGLVFGRKVLPPSPPLLHHTHTQTSDKFGVWVCLSPLPPLPSFPPLPGRGPILLFLSFFFKFLFFLFSFCLFWGEELSLGRGLPLHFLLNPNSSALIGGILRSTEMRMRPTSRSARPRKVWRSSALPYHLQHTD